MTETGKFFSPRNAIALVELWRAINDVEDDAIRQELRFAFTAILPRASMRYQWSAKRPLNAQNQTYYIAPVYFEWNVFDLYGRKVNAVIRANEALFDDGDLFNPEKVRDVSYEIASAEVLAHLDDGSVDYVFHRSALRQQHLLFGHEPVSGSMARGDDGPCARGRRSYDGATEERVREAL